ncbi:hypothetical protein BEL04_19105 [Mucilaginibacter sp. PPCGB 2223]|uniref:hypothetical protein n=1 Tax=Mucilaginibacter sp. PPCGB 2223 TaxID=1886027 RepID=UPI00082610F5|nr:hypothetical protein [Mucilaginibacter sp. PPCGB 2223]OCX50838.1 hypothetical protein BEL04_19105 [Mucilaginibacter sp. PPCGB 2223]
MKLQIPEYLLCEDPASETESLFIYHTTTRSLVHIIHTDILPKGEADKIRTNYRRHFDYTYKNTVGHTEKIMFIAEMVDPKNIDEQAILEKCAHWYACYLGWEEECDDVLIKKGA